LSDGAESGGASRRDRADSLEVVSDAAVLFYVVGVGFETDRPYLEELSRRSRGRLFEAFEGASIPSIYASLADLLRSQLVLTVESSAAADLPQRSIRVELSRAGATGLAERPYQSHRLGTAPDAVNQPARPAAPGMLIPVATVAISVSALLIAISVRRRRSGATTQTQDSDEVEVIPGPTADPIVRAPAPERGPFQARLVMVGGPADSRGTSFLVGEAPITLGTQPGCEIRLPEIPQLAGEHVRLWVRDGKLMLHHLARHEKTLLAGNPITWASLSPGDEVSIGPYVLRYVDGDLDRPDSDWHE
jgi:hypothetical protein